MQHFKWRAADFEKSEAKVDAIQMLQELHTFEHSTLSVLFLSAGRSYPSSPTNTCRQVRPLLWTCFLLLFMRAGWIWFLNKSKLQSNQTADPREGASGCVDLNSNHSFACRYHNRLDQVFDHKCCVTMRTVVIIIPVIGLFQLYLQGFLAKMYTCE